MLLFTTRRIWKDMKKRWAIMKLCQCQTGYNINKLKEKIASLAVTDDITHK